MLNTLTYRRSGIWSMVLVAAPAEPPELVELVEMVELVELVELCPALTAGERLG
jgi:hypothetical protein